MAQSIPCWTDSQELNRFREDGLPDPFFDAPNSYSRDLDIEDYRAAIEDSPHISITGLNIMWGNWLEFDPSKLACLLHGVSMCAPFHSSSEEYAELRFLAGVAGELK